jgi:hypothetical protein
MDVVAVPLPMNRDLFVTLEMLRAEGFDASVEFGEGIVKLRLDDHAAVFRAPERIHEAANWLAERVFIDYPESAFVKLWLCVAKAAAAYRAGNDHS